MKTTVAVFLPIFIVVLSIISFIQPALGDKLSWRVEYDDQGRIARRIDPAGRVIKYTYAPASGGPVQSTTATPYEGSPVTWQFDENGKLSSMKDGEGEVTYQYDNHGRIIVVVRKGEPAVQYSYDTAGRLSELKVGDFYRIDRTYDFLGRIAAIDTPAGRISYEYLAGQGMVVRSLPNGIKTIYKYKPNGELEEITHEFFKNPKDNSYSILAQYSYDYGPAGRIVAIRERSAQGDITKRYAYDTMGRLIKATGPGGREYSYTYDSVGNRTNATASGQPDQVISFDWAGRMTAINGKPCAYDGSGNVTDLSISGVDRRYRYHSDDRLAEARVGDETVQYRYDGFGRLVYRKAGSIENRFIPDPLSPYWLPLVIQESNNIRSIVIWDGSVPLGTMHNGKTEWFLHDHIGSVRIVADNKGNVTQSSDYEPFGSLLDGEPKRFMSPGYAGLYYDHGVQLTLARSYFCKIGAFLQPDPKRLLPNGSQTTNAIYTYCAGNPVNLIDKDGMEPEPFQYSYAHTNELIDRKLGNESVHEILGNWWNYGIPPREGSLFGSNSEYEHYQSVYVPGIGDADMNWRVIARVQPSIEYLTPIPHLLLALYNLIEYTGVYDMAGLGKTGKPDFSGWEYLKVKLNPFQSKEVKEFYRQQSTWSTVEERWQNSIENIRGYGIGMLESFIRDVKVIDDSLGAVKSLIPGHLQLRSKIIRPEFQSPMFDVRFRAPTSTGVHTSEWYKYRTSDPHVFITDAGLPQTQNSARAMTSMTFTGLKYDGVTKPKIMAYGTTEADAKEMANTILELHPEMRLGHDLFIQFGGASSNTREMQNMGRKIGADAVLVLRSRDAANRNKATGELTNNTNSPSSKYKMPVIEFKKPQPPRPFRRTDILPSPISNSWFGGGPPPGGGGGGSLLAPARPSPVGGVYLGGAGRAIAGFGQISGITIDANNNLVLLGQDGKSVKVPPLRVDDVVTIFRSVYLYGEGPTVTIDPASENPEESAMVIRHGKATEDTYVGWVLYEADRLMKSYTLGVDNKTQKEVVSGVAGYDEVLNAIFFGGESQAKRRAGGHWERFWIVPAEARRFEAPRKELTLLDVPLKVKTQSMVWRKGKLVDDPKGKSSPGALAFTTWFSGNYVGISGERFLIPPPETGINTPVPVFTELRRIALITAIAEKLRDQGIPMPFWMFDYEVQPVPFEKITPALRVTRYNRMMKSQVFGGVQLSPETTDVKSYNENSDLAGLTKDEREAVHKKVVLAKGLENNLKKLQLQVASLKPEKLSYEGKQYNVVPIPGAGTRALGPLRLAETDISVPLPNGRALELARRHNSFFAPKGPWGKGWALDFPRLVEFKQPLSRKDSQVRYQMAYELVTPLNSVRVRFF